LHERIRRHSRAVTDALKAGADKNDLLERLRGDPAFAEVDFDRLGDQKQFVGRSPEQVDEFLAAVVQPIRRRYGGLLGQTAEVAV
jgi:adenylosuccinate lyase